MLHDLIKGDVTFSTDEIGDFVIVRPDGSPLYNFASVVDDVDMEITHVVRAEEHLSNTFPQLLVFEALGAQLPAFAHVPYVAEPGSKAKMSKRKIKEYEKQGVLVYLHQYIEKGYLPEALLNYLARLGWSYDASQEIFTRAELIEKFTLDRVNSSPASHDQDKLFWIEGEWMKALPLDRKIAGVLPFLQNEGLVAEPLSDADRARVEAVILALGDRLKVFSDILKLGRFFFTTELAHDPDAVKKRLRKEGVPAMLAELDTRPRRRSSPTTWRRWRRPSTTTPSGSGRKMGDVVNPLARGDHRPGRRARGSTTACSSWAGRPAGPGSPRPWPAAVQLHDPTVGSDAARLIPSCDARPREPNTTRMRIFVTGSIAYDYIMVFPGRFRDHILPDKMHVLSVSFLVDSLKRRRGGTGGQHRLQPGASGRAARARRDGGRRLRRVPRVARRPRASTPRRSR